MAVRLASMLSYGFSCSVRFVVSSIKGRSVGRTPPMPAKRDAAIRALIDGAPGLEVKHRVSQYRKTLASLNGEMSKIRLAVYAQFEQTIPNELHDIAASDARLSSEIHTFLEAKPPHQVRIQKAHAAAPSWPADAERMLAACRLTPPGMDAFKLTKVEELELKKSHSVALIKKNEDIIYADAGQLLTRAISLLENAANTPKQGQSKLLLALLVVSGRREVEILNGRSVFQSADKGSFYAHFTGQAKTRGKPRPMTIPLMVHYDLFATALAAFRAMQGDVSMLTNE